MGEHTTPRRRSRTRRVRILASALALVLGSGALSAPAFAGAPDADRDGIPDSRDRCVNQPEDFDGDADADGCPDDRDTDGDGVMDDDDLCPTAAEDIDQDQDSDGCPDLRDDRDQDSIPDRADQCPYNPEDHDGFEDEDGCPEPDNDRDRVADTLDLCPTEPEDIDGDRDEDGCPDLLTEVTEEKIELKEKIFFDHDSTVIQPRSYAMLDEVARVLIEHEQMRVRIEGHTDDLGEDRYNLELSDGRAQAVAGYLTQKGVVGERLIPIGFGERQPLVENTDDETRATNRRVEFFILEEGGEDEAERQAAP